MSKTPNASKESMQVDNEKTGNRIPFSAELAPGQDVVGNIYVPYTGIEDAQIEGVVTGSISQGFGANLEQPGVCCYDTPDPVLVSCRMLILFDYFEMAIKTRFDTRQNGIWNRGKMKIVWKWGGE